MADSTVVLRSGLHLACTDSGAADLPPLVLLHALGEQGSDWDGVVLALPGEHHRTIAFDLRGHGGTDRPGVYSVAVMSEDVEEALDLLGVAGALVVGHSLGGMVAFHLAVRRPDLVRALVVEDVAPLEARPPRPVPDRPEVELPFDWDAVLALRAETDRGDPQLWEALATLEAPTLIVAGGAASSVDQDRLAAAAGRIPHATLRTLEAGHYVHRERPAEFAALVLGWWDALEVDAEPPRDGG